MLPQSFSYDKKKLILNNFIVKINETCDKFMDWTIQTEEAIKFILFN